MAKKKPPPSEGPAHDYKFDRGSRSMVCRWCDSPMNEGQPLLVTCPDPRATREQANENTYPE